MYLIIYNNKNENTQDFQGEPIKEEQLAFYIFENLCSELNFNEKNNFKLFYGFSAVVLATMKLKNCNFEYLSLIEFDKDEIDDLLDLYVY